MFERTLKIDDGKDLVRKHHSTHDAQRVYTDLKAFSLKSTTASLNAPDLLTYITSARLGDNSSWLGSALGFITHWENQVRQYDQTGDPSEILLDNTKLSLLQSAVHGILELRNVKEQASQFKVKTSNDITYS